MPPEGFVIGLLDSVLEGEKSPGSLKKQSLEKRRVGEDMLIFFTVKMIYFKKFLIIVMKKGLSLASERFYVGF